MQDLDTTYSRSSEFKLQLAPSEHRNLKVELETSRVLRNVKENISCPCCATPSFCCLVYGALRRFGGESSSDLPSRLS